MSKGATAVGGHWNLTWKRGVFACWYLAGVCKWCFGNGIRHTIYCSQERVMWFQRPTTYVHVKYRKSSMITYIRHGAQHTHSHSNAFRSHRSKLRRCGAACARASTDTVWPEHIGNFGELEIWIIIENYYAQIKYALIMIISFSYCASCLRLGHRWWRTAIEWVVVFGVDVIHADGDADWVFNVQDSMA